MNQRPNLLRAGNYNTLKRFDLIARFILGRPGMGVDGAR
jgi:hypothetical protein